MIFAKKPIKIGLALGGGGIRGLAHIGVIKALERNKIPIDFVAGSSIGSLIGGFYCYQKNIREVEDLLISLTKRQLASLFFSPSFKQGLISTEKIKKFVDDFVHEITVNNLKIPFWAIATDLKTGETVKIKDGLLSQAIVASGAIPLLFKPVIRNNHLLADGGLSMPVPVKAVREMGADFVIAVNLSRDYFVDQKNKYGFYKISNNTTAIMVKHLAEENVKQADWVICPETKHHTLNLFLNKEEKQKIIKQNEESVEKIIPDLKKLMADRSKSWLSKLLEL